ncbi:MAG TPA: DUF1761 domain-containing protein [Longimicrobium sp.]|nr:DUF1761 domain-containing protein [Longimicrobium sp.]
MPAINYLAVLVAAVAAFVVGAVWNGPLLFGTARTRLLGMDPNAQADTAMPAGKVLAEFARVLVVAFVLARFVALLGTDGWVDAVLLGVWLWIGFQAALLAGAVIWEKMPPKLYAIHAGDALAKVLLMAVILSAWR